MPRTLNDLPGYIQQDPEPSDRRPIGVQLAELRRERDEAVAELDRVRRDYGMREVERLRHQVAQLEQVIAAMGGGDE